MEHNELWERLERAVSAAVNRKRAQGYRMKWGLQRTRGNVAGHAAVFSEEDGACLSSMAVWIALDGRGYQFRPGRVGRLCESESPAAVAGYLLRRLNRNLKLRELA